MSDFIELLDELEIASEAVTGKEYENVNKALKRANKAMKAANKFARKHENDKAIRTCDDAIRDLESCKKHIEDTPDEEIEKFRPDIVSVVKTALVGLALTTAATTAIGVTGVAKATTDTIKGMSNAVQVDPDGVTTVDYDKAAATGEKAMKTGKIAGNAAVASKSAGKALTIIRILQSFIKQAQHNKKSLIAALDASIKSLETLKAACSADKSDEARESIYEFGIEAYNVFCVNGSFIAGCIESGFTDKEIIELIED